MKGKTLYIIIGVILVILLGIGGSVYYLLSGGSSTHQKTSLTNGQNIKTISPNDIGLSLKVRPDNKGVIMTVSKLTGVTSIEYELSYDAEETQDGQTANVPKGVVGSPITVNSTDSTITRNLDLGTCSRNVCRYDKVTSIIKVAIKVNYQNGTVGAVETTINLNK